MEQTVSPVYDLAGKLVWVAGHKGMVGSALVRRLQSENCRILTADRNELDLTHQTDVEDWVNSNRPQAVFMASAKVGGILANETYPADFLYDNIVIQTNIIQASYRAKVEKLMFLGSSCIYPKRAPQPIPESALLTGPLEPTNEWYAIAKIAGIKMCQAYRKQYGCDYISAMPTNLYGPGDNYDLSGGHVAAALLVKIHQAKIRGDKTFELWGSGTPLREFLHVDDLADALIFLMKYYSDFEHVNVGSGHEVSIRELAQLIADVIGFEGGVVFDASKPDGMARKLMDSSRLLDMGWSPKYDFKRGMAHTYEAYLKGLG